MSGKEDKKFEILALTFFKTWYEALESLNLTDAKFRAYIKAICDYCFYGKLSVLENPEKALFAMSKPGIDSSNKRKIAGHKGGTNARGKSGAPKGNSNAKQ